MVKKILVPLTCFLITGCNTLNTQLVYISKENLELICTVSKIDTIKLPDSPKKLGYKKLIEQEELDIIRYEYINELLIKNYLIHNKKYKYYDNFFKSYQNPEYKLFLSDFLFINLD